MLESLHHMIINETALLTLHRTGRSNRGLMTSFKKVITCCNCGENEVETTLLIKIMIWKCSQRGEKYFHIRAISYVYFMQKVFKMPCLWLIISFASRAPELVKTTKRTYSNELKKSKGQ